MSTPLTCRCCLTQQADKNLKGKYDYLGESEIYIEMLKKCFEIHLNAAEDDGICNNCVTRLRDANAFKELVLKSQITFKESLKNAVKLEDSGVLPTVKVELPDSDFFYGEDYIDDSVFDEDDKNLALIAIEQLAKKHKDLTVKKCKSKKVRKADSRPRKPVLTIKRLNGNPPIKWTCSRPKHKQDENIANILRNSNATPFANRTLFGYHCAYCRETLANALELRAHTREHRTEKIPLDYRKNNLKIDITDLKCGFCDASMDGLTNLKKHLTAEHKVAFHSDVMDCFLEFKLRDGERMDCCLCNATFETFKMLVQHMNNHYRNYVCDICDLGFINAGKLNFHRRVHEEGSFKCSMCEKIFTTTSKLKFHEKYSHRQEPRYSTKCPICQESFPNYYKRNRHMIDAHNQAAANYKCNVCDVTFLVKAKLTSHIKKVHLMEKNHICPECGHAFFQKRCLDEHMVKHKGERIYQCTVCLKAYARKKTLREHMRIHNNDRRFKCGVCDLSFVQKCSLKSHILSNHGITLAEFESTRPDA